ncbi:MAG TPA: NAD(P)H-hydrate dehydratase, partial [Thiobacillus sp.]
ILAGPGNNGGDALVAARHLSIQGCRVAVVSRADPARLPPDAARAWTAWRESGGAILADIPPSQRFSLVIDGLFGVGLARDVAGEEARWIAQANAMACPRLALDVPSGLDSDSGQIRGCAVRADHTLTFLGLKPGLLTADGPDYAGELHLDTLGVDPAALPRTMGSALTQLEDRHRLPARARNSHKGLYGHIGIIGGDAGMVGASLIAGRAALQAGAGSVTLGVLDTRIAVDFGEPRLMFSVPEKLVEMKLDGLAIGPGLGQRPPARALVDAALAAACPLVLDADALNLLAGDAELAKRVASRSHPTILTPHPGEAARLLGISPAGIQANRIEAAQRLGAQYHAHVALKGAGTVIAHPDGRYAINTTGGPWLAQAGSGDRLTGMVTALLGQGMAAADALEAAVWLHGKETPVQQIRDLR